MTILRSEEHRASDDETSSIFARLSESRPIVVLAPHPGDETLGCGMLLAAAFAAKGARVVSLSRGAERAASADSSDLSVTKVAARRAAEVEAAIRVLGGGARDIDRWGWPLGHVPSSGRVLERAVAWVEALCVSSGARCLYASGPDSTHVDHLAGALLAHRVAERLPALRVLHYTLWPRAEDDGESVSSASSIVHRLSDARWKSSKLRAVRCHRSQLAELDAAPNGRELRRTIMQRLVEDGERFVEARR